MNSLVCEPHFETSQAAPQIAAVAVVAAANGASHGLVAVGTRPGFAPRTRARYLALALARTLTLTPLTRGPAPWLALAAANMRPVSGVLD